MPTFAAARQFLLDHRLDYDKAVAGFAWPEPVPFNWALDWFDARLASDADSRDRLALRIVDTAAGRDESSSFADLACRSSRTASFLRGIGLKRGDHLLLLLGNVLPLWETMLAAMKLGAVVIPATTLLTADELADRLERGRVKLVVAEADQVGKFEGLAMEGIIRVAVGADPRPGWHDYADVDACRGLFVADGPTGPEDPLLLYFTSGTTSKPKLVRHSHRSYPVGALSTMYWLGVKPGDLHLNVSSPGWAKHAWSSFFAPWNAGATILAVRQPKFDAKVLLGEIARCGVTTLCAPPTVWRLLIQEDLSVHRMALRELCAAGEPLNPEVIGRVRDAWGLTIRDGYGQTETTAIVANAPGQAVKPGAMGRPLPGYAVSVLDADGRPAREGEVCLARTGPTRPAGLMQGYEGPAGELLPAEGDLYRTGDVALRDADGTLTFVGRTDDVFKSSDYRISPFELESVLIEHPAVTEAAVVPAPDPIRLWIPKAYVTLTASAAPTAETAASIFAHVNGKLAPFKRIRRIEIVRELPKTISGKIRRVQLRRLELEDDRADPLRGVEFLAPEEARRGG